MTTFDHLDRIDQSAHKLEALALAAGTMASACINADLINEITDIAADLAAGIRGDVGALLDENKNARATDPGAESMNLTTTEGDGHAEV